MKPRNGALVALLFLATCNVEDQKDNSSAIESAQSALGVVPPTEVAVWRKVGSSTNPDGRYLQAVAFDEARKVFVMFGGTNTNPNTGSVTPNQETWEWSQSTGKWTNRIGAGTSPDARSGAAMVFDSVRGKFVLFGGRAGSGFNYEDTWEWDPATGVWTDVSAAGGHPSARSQHGMVYEKSTGKVLLFGGGRSDSASYDGTGITVSLGDTWEYDPTTYAWTARTVASAPSVRHDFGMVWDSSRNKAVLFAGMQTDIAGAGGVRKQDTWEWDPAASTWTERTVSGSKPSQRYAHAMAFDGNRKKVVVFGGWDMSSGGSKNDLWDWEPTTGAWTQRLTGSEGGVPSPRMYASLVADDADARMELVAGISAYGSYGSPDGGIIIMPPGMGGSGTGSRDVWELDPAKPAFTNRTAPLDVPSSRYSQAMAYNPSTGRTYVYGGSDAMTGQYLDDLWEWDGKVWAQVAVEAGPPARAGAGLAYDPARKSLILFGGSGNTGTGMHSDTWEWGSTRKWTQLSPSSSPDPRFGHGMVTDSTRNKILLFAGISNYYFVGPGPGIYKEPMRNDVWEWDGAAMTWTNRTPPASVVAPTGGQYPIMAYDEGRQKMFLYDWMNSGGSLSAFWEWDPVSAGWASRDTGDSLDYGYQSVVAYDSIRRREILLTDAYSPSMGYQETWELDAKGPTWYVRALPGSPGASYGATMVFDSARGVAVLYGGQGSTGMGSIDTWEYKVSSVGNGQGCAVSSATTCASGNCVDGVCCDVAACTGACKSCNVAGSEGTCVLAKAGTEVAGSCSNGQACDGSGTCKAKNGQACTAASACASGNCVDGVCCDSACTGPCSSCSQAGRAGKCSPYLAGTDPQGECGAGTGVCKSTCDGVGACAYPQRNVPCANCYTCDGMGTCSNYDYFCGMNGGAGGSYDGGYGGSGGRIIDGGAGGSGGYTTSKGGAGGSFPNSGGAGGSRIDGGTLPNSGGVDGGGLLGSGGRAGSGGSIPNSSGSGGGNMVGSGGRGGSVVNPGGSGGSIISIVGSGGGSGKRDGGVGDASSVANFNKSGCSCEVGQANRADAGLSTSLLIAGIALLLVRKRRRRG